MRKTTGIVIVIVALGLGLAAWWASRGGRPDEGLAVEREDVAESVPVSTAPVSPASELARKAVENVAPAQPTAASTHRLTGRVLDETRRPVAGAQVELRIDTALVVSGASAVDGSFELVAALGERDGNVQGGVRARDGTGRSGVRFEWIPLARPGELVEVSFDAIVLESSHALHVRVHGASGPAAGASVRAMVGGQTRTLIEARDCDERGELLLTELPHGPIHVEARLGDRVGRAVAYVSEETEVEIELTRHDVVEVHVVDARTDAGVAGAELTVNELAPVPMPYGAHQDASIGSESMTWFENAAPGARTDCEGRARLLGLHPGGHYSLCVDAHGYVRVPARRHWPGLPLAPDESPLRIALELVSLRSVRWPIVAGELPPPPDGPLELRVLPGTRPLSDIADLPGPARIESGVVVVEAVQGRVQVHALTNDGAIAVVQAKDGETTGEPVAFRRARRIEVLVRDARGAPVAGAGAIARSGQGNNAICEEALTDSDGRAELAGLYGGLASVSVRSVHGTDAWIAAGSVDLDAGDGRVEATLPSIAHARVRLLVDGEPRLPARYSVRSQASAKVVAEDPERGELRVAFHAGNPGDLIVFSVHAVDYLPAMLELTLPADGSDAEGELALERGTRLIVRIARPASGDIGILPQRFDAGEGEWKGASLWRYYSPLKHSNGPGASFVFDGLSPGRWRVLEHESRIASSEVVVQGGEREVELELDLATMEYVAGRVELPDPAETGHVIVRRVGAALGTQESFSFHQLPGAPEGEQVLEDGSFRMLLPVDRDSELVPWHPFYVPAKEGGVARVRGGSGNVVLRMVAGSELRLPVSQLDSSMFQGRPELRIARYAGEPRGAPLEWHLAPILGGIARCAMPEGRWTLWIDPSVDFAPFVLRDVVVEGITVLPEQKLESGTRLNVKVLVDEGAATPRIYVHFRSSGEPPYGRSVFSRGEALVQVPGFLPGTFEVHAGDSVGGRSLALELTFTDGEDRTIEFDLR